VNNVSGATPEGMMRSNTACSSGEYGGETGSTRCSLESINLSLQNSDTKVRPKNYSSRRFEASTNAISGPGEVLFQTRNLVAFAGMLKPSFPKQGGGGMSLGSILGE
jgi:hypothetical protein